MLDYIKLAVLGAIAVLAAIAANYAHDLAYMVNALTVMLAAAATFVWVLRGVGTPRTNPLNEYNDGVVRAGVIATASLGRRRLSGRHVHRLPARLSGAELSDLALGPELRPAAAAAHLGGDLRLRRQCADRDLILRRPAHLRDAALGRQRRLVRVLGLQLFIVLAATGYVLGSTQSQGIRRAGMVRRPRG